MAQGCHFDAGYAHMPKGISSEMIYGAAFAAVPDPPGANASGVPIGTSSWRGNANATGTPLQPQINGDEAIIDGAVSLLLPAEGSVAFTAGFAGEGFVVEAGKDYEGFVVVRSSAPLTLQASLQDVVVVSADVAAASSSAGGGLQRQTKTLAVATISCPGGNVWTRVNFTLVPTASTSCTGISQATADAIGVACPEGNRYQRTINPAAHICVNCRGSFALAHSGGSGGSSVRVGYASLQPGTWGRFAGLPVNADRVAAWQSMGLQFMRQGGSFADPSSLNGPWWEWRGPVWKRPVENPNKSP